MGCCKDQHIDEMNKTDGFSSTEIEILKWVENFIWKTERGKKWLSDMAAKVGVPLQIALPLKSAESAKESER